MLVGGTCRIPLIENMTREFFNGKELNRQLAPEEAVCRGTTLYAASLSGNFPEIDLQFTDVIPLSLGTDIENDGLSVILPRNSQYPCEKKKTYKTVEDNQDHILIKVLQGDKSKASENHLL